LPIFAGRAMYSAREVRTSKKKKTLVGLEKVIAKLYYLLLLFFVEFGRSVSCELSGKESISESSL
jgi:hypothetical protein